MQTHRDTNYSLIIYQKLFCLDGLTRKATPPCGFIAAPACSAASPNLQERQHCRLCSFKTYFEEAGRLSKSLLRAQWPLVRVRGSPSVFPGPPAGPPGDCMPCMTRAAMYVRSQGRRETAGVTASRLPSSPTPLGPQRRRSRACGGREALAADLLASEESTMPG